MKFNKIRYMVQIPESIDHFIHGVPYYRDLRRPGFYLHLIKRLTPNPGLLQSVGWDYKPRSRLHMTLAVGGTLNPNQPTIFWNPDFKDECTSSKDECKLFTTRPTGRVDPQKIF